MGVLAPGSAHARPSAQPPISMRKFVGTLVYRVTFLHLPQLLRNQIQSFGTQTQLL